MTATLYKANGTRRLVQLKKETMLGQLQTLVGGYIETVPIHNTGTMLVVNEDGIPKNLPVNKKASEICGQQIVGDAVRMRREDLD